MADEGLISYYVISHGMFERSPFTSKLPVFVIPSGVERIVTTGKLSCTTGSKCIKKEVDGFCTNNLKKLASNVYNRIDVDNVNLKTRSRVRIHDCKDNVLWDIMCDLDNCFFVGQCEMTSEKWLKPAQRKGSVVDGSADHLTKYIKSNLKNKGEIKTYTYDNKTVSAANISSIIKFLTSLNEKRNIVVYVSTCMETAINVLERNDDVANAIMSQSEPSELDRRKQIGLIDIAVILDDNDEYDDNFIRNILVSHDALWNISPSNLHLMIELRRIYKNKIQKELTNPENLKSYWFQSSEKVINEKVINEKDKEIILEAYGGENNIGIIEAIFELIHSCLSKGVMNSSSSNNLIMHNKFTRYIQLLYGSRIQVPNLSYITDDEFWKIMIKDIDSNMNNAIIYKWALSATLFYMDPPELAEEKDKKTLEYAIGKFENMFENLKISKGGNPTMQQTQESLTRQPTQAYKDILKAFDEEIRGIYITKTPTLADVVNNINGQNAGYRVKNPLRTSIVTIACMALCLSAL